MKIEIWSDINCPYCYISKQIFDEALQFLKINKDEVEYKSYLLDPEVDTDPQRSDSEYQMTTYKFTPLKLERLRQQQKQMAWKAGINIDFDTIVVANSLNAHRLIHLAKQMHKQDEMVQRLFEAHFEEGKNIDNVETLLAIAEEIGLPLNKSEAVVFDKDFFQDVVDDQKKAYQYQIKSVPFYVINEKYSIGGIQTKEEFVEILTQLQIKIGATSN